MKFAVWSFGDLVRGRVVEAELTQAADATCVHGVVELAHGAHTVGKRAG